MKQKRKLSSKWKFRITMIFVWMLNLSLIIDMFPLHKWAWGWTSDKMIFVMGLLLFEIIGLIIYRLNNLENEFVKSQKKKESRT